MKVKKYDESNVIIMINTLRKIIDIFLGPFMTAYFIKISSESLLDLSLYNIFKYCILGIGGIIIGNVIKNKFQLGIFRIGIIANFVYILAIIVLRENILNNLPLISFLYGFSAITYYFPYNLFTSSKVKNKNRNEYELKKRSISTLVGILAPIVLGGIITTTNFQLTAIIILFISLIQILLSFFLKPSQYTNKEFAPVKVFFNTFIKNKEVMKLFILDFFKGLVVYESALEVVMTILVFNAFKTDLNLGILSSVSSLFFILVHYIYTKKYKNKNDGFILLLCALIPIISVFLLISFTNDITLILYYFLYNTLINLLAVILDVRLFNYTNSRKIKAEDKMEFWSIREVILNFGRIVGYLLLFFIAKMNKYNYLYHLLVLFTLSIAIMAFICSRIKKNKSN